MANPLTYVRETSALKLMGDDNPEFVTLAKYVLEHMAANDGTGGIYTSNVGNASFSLIGSFTDTSYAGNIGEANTTIISSSYNLYQNLSTVFINWSDTANGILQAAVNAEPGETLFETTTVGGRSLGDIDNTGTITSADALSASKYGQGTLTDPTEIAYIENTLEPYMLGNLVTYAAYINNYLEDEPPRPLTFNTEANSIRPMTDSQIEDMANSILTWGLLNEGPHSFVLEESAPSDGGTWTSLGTLTDVYANSISTPIETNKNLYKKLTSDAFTLNRPLKYFTNGTLREFTNTEVSNIARKVRERIVATGIGTYLFQETTPSPGTWVAKGNIINTIATVNNDGINYQTERVADTFYVSVQPDSSFFTLGYSTSYTNEDAIGYLTEYIGDYEGPGQELYTQPRTYSGGAFTRNIYNISLFFPAFTTYEGAATGIAYYEGPSGFFNTYTAIVAGGGVYEGIAISLYNVTNPDAFSYLGASPATYTGVAPISYTNTLIFYTGSNTVNYLSNRFFAGDVAYASSIYGQHFLGIPYLRNVVSFSATYLGGSPGNYLAPTARTTNYIGQVEYTTAINFSAFLPVFYTGSGFFTGLIFTSFAGFAPDTVYYAGPGFFDYTSELPTNYTGPGLIGYTGKDISFYVSNFPLHYTVQGGPIYFQEGIGTFVTTWAEFNQFTTGFLKSVGPIIQRSERAQDIIYTDLDVDYTSIVFQPGQAFYDAFLGIGPTEIVVSFYSGPGLYTGVTKSGFSTAAYYDSQQYLTTYEGASALYQTNFQGVFSTIYAGSALFVDTYTADYLGPGDVTYTGTDTYTGVYLGLLIEDTPVQVQTITFWRRVA